MRDKKKNNDWDWWIITNDQNDWILSVNLSETIQNSEEEKDEVASDDMKLKFRDKPEWICI